MGTRPDGDGPAVADAPPAGAGRAAAVDATDTTTPTPRRRRVRAGSSAPAPGHPEGVAGGARRHRLRPRRRRLLGALLQDLRAPGLRHRLREIRLVVGAAGGRGRDRLVLLLRRHAVRAAQGGPPARPVEAAGQADVRLAGHHQLASHRQRLRLGLRLPLVPSLRRRQHAGRLGARRHAGGRLGEPLPARPSSGWAWRPRRVRPWTWCPCSSAPSSSCSASGPSSSTSVPSRPCCPGRSGSPWRSPAGPGATPWP